MTSPEQDPDTLPPSPGDELSVDQALRLIADAIEPVDATQRVDLRSALNRVLAVDLLSPVDVPPADSCAMDGFALRASELVGDGESLFLLAGVALAGRPFTRSVPVGHAVRVTTGALLPSGVDTVVVQEAARVDGSRIFVPSGQQPGANRRQRGESLARGTLAARAGRLLKPADLGMLASIGIGDVPVRRQLRVAYFSTGDELRPLGSRLDPGQIYDSNRYTLFGMLHRIGVDLIDMGIVPDDPIALEATLRNASERADVILSSGGVSVGEADFTREVMARLGEVLFWKIAMRPGRPLAFGRIGSAYYFGLPGNPVASMTSFYFLVRDALYRLMGADQASAPRYRARALDGFAKRVGRTEFQRGIFGREAGGELTVRSTGDQGSAILRSMTQANCMVLLAHERGTVAPGESVDIVPFEALF